MDAVKKPTADPANRHMTEIMMIAPFRFFRIRMPLCGQGGAMPSPTVAGWHRRQRRARQRRRGRPCRHPLRLRPARRSFGTFTGSGLNQLRRMSGAYEGGVNQMRQRIGLVAIERGIDPAARPTFVADCPANHFLAEILHAGRCRAWKRKGREPLGILGFRGLSSGADDGNRTRIISLED